MSGSPIWKHGSYAKPAAREAPTSGRTLMERESGRGDGLSLVSWGARFDDPIALANGRKLLTLQGAATHITNLPKKESDLPEWQAAIEALMLVADRRIGVMRALNRHVEHVFDPSRKERHWGQRKLARDR